MAAIDVSGSMLKRMKDAHEQFLLIMGLSAAECPFVEFALIILLGGLEDMEAANTVARQAQKEGILPGALVNVH